MAKAMARIQNGVVTNLEWVDDNIVETDDLKNVYDFVIEVGDTYADGRFYRNDVEVLTFRDKIRNSIVSYDNVLTEIAAYISAPIALAEGETPTIDDRKTAILERVNDMITALEMLEVTPSE